MNAIRKLIEADRWTPKKLLVIGDGMTDVYVHGTLSDCQEGCQKFTEATRAEVPGGAANAARSLKHWFARKHHLHDRRSGPVKTRFMVEDRCVFRHDDERTVADPELVRREWAMLLTAYRPDGVLISDYDKGLLTPEFIAEVVEHCEKYRVPCVADAKREPATYAGAILKGNAEYHTRYAALLPFSGQLVITGGGRNPTTWTEGKPWGLGTDLPEVQCVNHVGAGDAFAAHLTLALAYGFGLREAAAVAHSAGRVYVQRRHNEPPHPDQIRDDMEWAGGVV